MGSCCTKTKKSPRVTYRPSPVLKQKSSDYELQPLYRATSPVHERLLEMSNATPTPPLSVSEPESESIGIENKREEQEEEDNKFREGEQVRCRIDGCTTWLEAQVVDILEDEKFRIRLYRGVDDHVAQIIKSKWIRIVTLDKIRKNSKMAPRITLESNVEQGLIDLYLNGRSCHAHLKQLSASILTLYNQQNKNQMDVDDEWTSYRLRKLNINYMESRMIAMEILSFCYEPAYKLRVHCFWCNRFGVNMRRKVVRSHLIASGAVNVGYGTDLSLMGFCDLCNTELDDADYSFRCDTKEHDICMQCLWKVKQQHIDLNRLLEATVVCLDHYSVQCIADYVVGDVCRRLRSRWYDARDGLITLWANALLSN